MKFETGVLVTSWFDKELKQNWRVDYKQKISKILRLVREADFHDDVYKYDCILYVFFSLYLFTFVLV